MDEALFAFVRVCFDRLEASMARSVTGFGDRHCCPELSAGYAALDAGFTRLDAEYAKLQDAVEVIARREQATAAVDPAAQLPAPT